MTRIAALGGLVAAFLIFPAAAGALDLLPPDGGGSQPPSATPTPAPQEQSLSIAVKPPEVLIGRRVRISGTLSAGTSSGHLDLVVPLANGKFDAVAHTRADAQGNYSFLVRPQLNTRYQVETSDRVIGGTITRSPVITVTVFPKLRLEVTPLEARPRVALGLLVTGGYGAIHLRSKRGYFYAREKRSKVFQRLGSDKLRDIGSAGFGASIVVPDRRLRRVRELFACTKSGPFREMGDIGFALCGRHVISRSALPR